VKRLWFRYVWAVLTCCLWIIYSALLIVALVHAARQGNGLLFAGETLALLVSGFMVWWGWRESEAVLREVGREER
jgi:hypothetical protein